MNRRANKLYHQVWRVLERYENYKQYLRYPGDWGERALRGWLVREVFQDLLGWSSEATLWGELFDVLFVDEQLTPVIYLETKKPEIVLTRQHCRYTLQRAARFPTLRYTVLTNGWLWQRWDGGHFSYRSPDGVLDLRQSPSKTAVAAFFAPLCAERFREVTR